MPVEEPRVEHVHRDDGSRRRQGGLERGVIVEPKVAPVPQERDPGHPYGARAIELAILSKTGASVAARSGVVENVST